MIATNKEPIKLTTDIFPAEGLSYPETMRLLGCTFHEAKVALNAFFNAHRLIRGGERNGWTFWVKETPDLSWTEKGRFGEKYEKLCVECGTAYRTNQPGQKFCGTACSEPYRMKHRTDNRRKQNTGNATRRRAPSRFDRTRIKEVMKDDCKSFSPQEKRDA